MPGLDVTDRRIDRVDDAEDAHVTSAVAQTHRLQRLVVGIEAFQREVRRGLAGTELPPEHGESLAQFERFARALHRLARAFPHLAILPPQLALARQRLGLAPGPAKVAARVVCVRRVAGGVILPGVRPRTTAGDHPVPGERRPR